jgi:hypothetical protein
MTYRYAWRLTKLWGPAGSPLYNRRCKVLARALNGKNGRLVQFEDGEQHIISGNALRRVR